MKPTQYLALMTTRRAGVVEQRRRSMQKDMRYHAISAAGDSTLNCLLRAPAGQILSMCESTTAQHGKSRQPCV
eukprot:6188752-Pleurochrysis_carterae.AAC.1